MPVTVTDPTPVREYLGSIRRHRQVYAGAVALGVVVLAVAAFVIIARGEISHATLRTVDTPPASVPAAAPAATLRQSWSSTDHGAIGQPLSGGTVITYDTHTVRGRDAQTGAETWSYTRSDRVVCTAAQISGTTVAVYANKGNCDQLTALDSGTGRRMWTRTVSKDGHPVNGTPAFDVGNQTLMMTTPSVIYAIAVNPGETTDTSGCAGCDRWSYAPTGCTIQSAVWGNNGALIQQNCTDPDCPATTDGKDGPTICGPGQQLLLRDANAGRTDDGDNKDQVKWTLLNSTLRPAAADGAIIAVDPETSELVVLNQPNGTQIGKIPLGGSLGSDGLQHVGIGSDDLFWSDGYAFAVRDSALAWKAQTDNVPTSAPIVAQQGATTVVLDDTTGAASGKTTGLPSVRPTDRIYPLGTGYLVTGSSTAAYR